MLVECDTCNQPIYSSKEAYFEWREARTNEHIQTDFSIVHQHSYSPVGNCYGHRYGMKDEGYMSLPFESLVRADAGYLTFKMGDDIHHLTMAHTLEWTNFRERFRLLRFTSTPRPHISALEQGVEWWNENC